MRVCVRLLERCVIWQPKEKRKKNEKQNAVYEFSTKMILSPNERPMRRDRGAHRRPCKCRGDGAGPVDVGVGSAIRCTSDRVGLKDTG